jgi:hypothetical protein
VISPEEDLIHESALERFVQEDRYQPATLVEGLQNQADFQRLVLLKSGESKSFVVEAAKFWNPSGIALKAGSTYDVRVEGDQTWTDWYVVAGPDGYTLEALRPWDYWKRVPSQNWFKLTGTISRDEKSPIPIGKALTNFSPNTSGELVCFANDIPWMYWNNRGSISVKVTRVK